jgi:hypothetical protein
MKESPKTVRGQYNGIWVEQNLLLQDVYQEYDEHNLSQ